jgi:hypothetical protein
MNYKMKKNFEGSIYNIPVYLRYTKVSVNLPIIILDMNNDLNKICGIGLIRNQYKYINTFNIYKESNYNRYTYISKYYININDEDARDMYIRNVNNFEKVLEILENKCFVGKGHLKRGSGFTKFPLKYFDDEEIYDIKEVISNMFKFKYEDDKELIDMLYIK